ncbi:MAG: SRPBCC family protein [Gammaproteobacteria bacterium]|nr:SRPBCC family protein [Gammaproteobacteria bacterium]HJO12751.1 SRPBCC family protein [Gammaproteobacteria bacterium]
MPRRAVEKSAINASSEAVWDYVTDFTKAGLWMTGVSSLVRLDEGDIGRGSHLQVEAGGQCHESTVSYWQPGKCFALSSQLDGVGATFTYRIEGVAETSTLELSIECTFGGFNKLIAPAIFWRIRRRGASQVNNVKSQLEQVAGPDIPPDA